MLNENDKQDAVVENCAQFVDIASSLLCSAKEKQSNVTQVIYVDNNGNDAVLNVYDFNFYTWKSTDTFDNLANDFLGDASLGTVLAYYNKVVNESELKAGTKIKIPVLKESVSNTNNKIYAIPAMQDNYGIDICISDNGDFSATGGDLGFVSGSANLSQAIALRLTTASKKRIRLTSYGIRATAGDNVALKSYLVGSIEQTVKADPRIKSIESLSFKGDGDKLYCNITYIDINGEQGTFESSL